MLMWLFIFAGGVDGLFIYVLLINFSVVEIQLYLVTLEASLDDLCLSCPPFCFPYVWI